MTVTKKLPPSVNSRITHLRPKIPDVVLSGETEAVAGWILGAAARVLGGEIPHPRPSSWRGLGLSCRDDVVHHAGDVRWELLLVLVGEKKGSWSCLPSTTASREEAERGPGRERKSANAVREGGAAARWQKRRSDAALWTTGGGDEEIRPKKKNLPLAATSSAAAGSSA